MNTIELKILNEYRNEYVTIQLNQNFKQFSEAKLYIPKVKGIPSVIPNKRWYVYYSYRNPVTNKMQQFKDHCKINTYKTVRERKAHGKNWVNGYNILLQQGFNPFTKNGIDTVKQFETTYTVREAMDYAFDNKIGILKQSSINDFKTRKNLFLEWCATYNLDNIDIRELKDVHMINFFNWLISPIGRNVGGTSQDNYKRCLSSLFAKLVRDKIIIANLVTEIQTTKNKPSKNTPFTGLQVVAIKKYLMQHDKKLYHFIQFVIYTFLRPVEIVRLRVEDIKYNEKYLKVETKTEKVSVKKLISPILLFLDSVNINNLPLKAHLFTMTDNIEVWDASEKTKVDYFGNKFKKVKKHFGFGAEYGIYSFRHTAALDLYFSFIKQGLTERESILKLMPITGHVSEVALRKYLRDVGGMIPKDYGADYTLDF